MELVIDRKVWLRGESVGSKLLRTADGKRCCVGIYLSALGVPDETLRERGDACYIENLPESAKWLVERRGTDRAENSDAACDLYSNNDKCGFFDTIEREARIAAGFAKQGVEVRFVG